MGQYGNQPDFGTQAAEGFIQGQANDEPTGRPMEPSALYIGTGGTLICRVVGGNANGFSAPGTGYTIFKNIPDGTFFPVIVDRIWATDYGSQFTTCADIIALQ